MKRLGKLLVMLVLVSSSGLDAQGCDPAKAAWGYPGATATFLGVITGDYSRMEPATWAKLAEDMPPSADGDLGLRAYHLIAASQMAAASKLLDPVVAPLLADTALAIPTTRIGVTSLEMAGLAVLAAGDPAQAQVLLATAYGRAGDSLGCRIHIELLLARYCSNYGMEAPQFAHFNSGFFNYLQDSLAWKVGAPTPSEYVVALNTMVHLYRLDRNHSALYLELLGDLLSKDPQRFTANYLASLAYMRAGLHLGGAANAIYERKALFALEAPRQAELRFNLYRFTQLKKALAEDVDSSQAMQSKFAEQDAKAIAAGESPYVRFGRKWSREPITAGFVETDKGRLPAMLAKSKAQLAARELEFKRYAGDIDLKDSVKKDNRFNAYALILIGMIVVAVIFIWRKLREAASDKA